MTDRNPVSICHEYGHKIGYLYANHMNDFIEAASASYMSSRNIPNRINFLYDIIHKKKKKDTLPFCSKTLKLSIIEDIICIDSSQSGISIILLRGLNENGDFSYSIRQCMIDEQQNYRHRIPIAIQNYCTNTYHGCNFKDIAKTQSNNGDASKKKSDLKNKCKTVHLFEHSPYFWNFSNHHSNQYNGVTIHEPSLGFHDWPETQIIVNDIVYMTKHLGF